MKKVGVVSCYFKHNYGSMLQAYATQKALDKLGIDNETINIDGFNGEIKRKKIKYFAKASLTSDILRSKAGMAKNVVIRKLSRGDYTIQCRLRDKRFEDFKNKYFRLSSSYGSTHEAGENYDCVLVGSDQLWLPVNIAADYYTLSWTPSSTNTISYSTSFGQASLPNNVARQASIFLKNINHVSVRETTGQNLVYYLTGRKVPVVCDPTMLFTGGDWLDIQQQEPICKEPYILCYFLGNNPPHREFAKRLKEKTGCHIIALPHIDEYIKGDEDYADIMDYDVDPADFLNLIRNASYVCTDSFHCTVFSIMYGRQFFTFRRYGYKTQGSTNSRLDTLFSMTGLNNRLLVGDEDIVQCLNICSDFDLVSQKLAEERAKSYSYLETSLKDQCNTDL